MAVRTVERKDFHWTFGAFATVGLAGLILNQVVSTKFGVAALGRYTLLLSVVIIGGQIGTMGIQGSVLFHTPKASTEGRPTSPLLSAGLLATFLTSAVATSAILVGGEIIFRSLDNQFFLGALRAIALGLFLYPMNKTMLAYINALQRVPLFSVFFASRFVFLAALALVVALTDNSGDYLIWTISLTELLMAFFLTLSLKREIKFLRNWEELRIPFRAHLEFGFKGFLGSTLLDLNTRIDVLLLGAIAGSRSVGIYSIASLFAEGLYQAGTVPRFNYDPVVTRLFVESQYKELQNVVSAAKRRLYMVGLPVLLLANILYPIVVKVLFGDELATESQAVFLILTLGIAASVGYLPFVGILQQVGFPGRQSMLLASTAGTNLILNLALIPPMGVRGAALATTLSWVAFVIFLRKIARPILRFAI